MRNLNEVLGKRGDATGARFASKAKNHGQKTKSVSPRDTKTSALRKQAVLEKAAASSEKPVGVRFFIILKLRNVDVADIIN